MSTTTCLSCFATTSNGLVLCEACRVRVTVHLDFLPAYFANLARWRPGRAGSRPVPGSREPSSGITEADDRVSRALDEVGADIAGWARALADDRCLDLPAQGDEAATFAELCHLLTENLTSIGTLGWAGEFVGAVARNESWLRALTEEVVPGWYAGPCRRCGVSLYVVPELTWVTCPSCSITVNVSKSRDHLDAVLDEARDWVATPKQLAGAIVALVDEETDVESLRKRIAIWGSRDHLAVHRPHDYAIKRYRLGDVLDLLARKDATRGDSLAGAVDAC